MNKENKKTKFPQSHYMFLKLISERYYVKKIYPLILFAVVRNTRG
jgi:hypothetical protein